MFIFACVPNLDKLHSNLFRRGAHRKIFKFNAHYMCIKFHQTSPISLYLKDSYDLGTVSYSILYRTSTWRPAVRKDDFSSPTAMPTVLKLTQPNRFPVASDVFNPLTNAYPSNNE